MRCKMPPSLIHSPVDIKLFFFLFLSFYPLLSALIPQPPPSSGLLEHLWKAAAGSSVHWSDTVNWKGTGKKCWCRSAVRARRAGSWFSCSGVEGGGWTVAERWWRGVVSWKRQYLQWEKYGFLSARQIDLRCVGGAEGLVERNVLRGTLGNKKKKTELDFSFLCVYVWETETVQHTLAQLFRTSNVDVSVIKEIHKSPGTIHWFAQE